MLGCRDVSFKSPWDCLSTNKRLSLQVYKQLLTPGQPINTYLGQGCKKTVSSIQTKKSMILDYNQGTQPPSASTELPILLLVLCLVLSVPCYLTRMRRTNSRGTKGLQLQVGALEVLWTSGIYILSGGSVSLRQFTMLLNSSAM